MIQKINKILLLIIMGILLIGCVSSKKNIFSKIEILSKNEIEDKSQKIIEEKYNEIIDKSNIGLYKNVNKDWRIILYGSFNYYRIVMKENGYLVKVEKLDYK